MRTIPKLEKTRFGWRARGPGFLVWDEHAASAEAEYANLMRAVGDSRREPLPSRALPPVPGRLRPRSGPSRPA